MTIARSIANNPSILLLDEPTGDLDTKSTDIIMKILVDLNRNHGITMIMVTHDQGLKYLANRVVKMSDGKILKIQEIEASSRKRVIEDLEDKVRAHNNGAGANRVQIREGIYEASVKRDIERAGHLKIPENFTPLQGIQTSKTSLRNQRDYPVLGNRFSSDK